MKKILSIATILAGLILICVEFLWETHILLTITGFYVGVWMVIEGILELKNVVHGYILRWKSFWIGLHFSDINKRYCLNLLPCVTLWWVKRDGKVPNQTL